MASQLKILRIARDLSQDRLAELTGFSQSRISRIERGVIKPTPKELAQIQAVLKARKVKANLETFLGGDDDLKID